jgi:YD repeat-containing protein
MERDAANELTQTAQEGYNTVRQQYDAKREEAEPHRARRRELREAVNSLQVRRSVNDAGVQGHRAVRHDTWGHYMPWQGRQRSLMLYETPSVSSRRACIPAGMQH